LAEHNIHFFHPVYQLPELIGSGRVAIWKDLIDLLNSGTMLQLLFGYGVGGIELHPWFTSTVVSGHSMYIEILFSYGILGLILFIIVIALGFLTINISNLHRSEKSQIHSIVH